MAKQNKQTGEKPIVNPYTGSMNLSNLHCIKKAWDEGYDAARSSVAQEIKEELEKSIKLDACDIYNITDGLRITWQDNYPARFGTVDGRTKQIIEATIETLDKKRHIFWSRYIKEEK